MVSFFEQPYLFLLADIGNEATKRNRTTIDAFVENDGVLLGISTSQ